jgi:hypothetical protein
MAMSVQGATDSPMIGVSNLSKTRILPSSRFRSVLGGFKQAGRALKNGMPTEIPALQGDEELVMFLGDSGSSRHTGRGFMPSARKRRQSRY